LTWVVTPSPGPHPKEESIPLLVIVRDILGIVETAKDAKKIIKMGEIFVDGKSRKDHKFPVGLMDVIEIPKMEKIYRVVPFKHGLKLIEIPKKEAKLKLCRINNKTTVRGGKIQLNLHDGRNILVEKDVYKTGDSILIEIPEQKIVDHVKMEKGNMAIIIGGENRGKVVKVEEVIVTRSREPNKAICLHENEKIITIKDYVFMVGKDKPLIKITE